MNKDRWERLKQIFGDALEREPAAREEFLREAANDDPELLAELLRMLAENEADSGLFSLPVLAGARTAAPPDKPRFGPSDLLARRYRIVRFIARGGMGEVYEAEDLELGERVALKAIRQRVAPHADLQAMLKREIQLARRVTHPNVCRIFDLAHHEDPDSGGTTLLLSMELIEGRTLADHLRHNGPLPFREALPLIEDIASGLQAVHDAGIVHGDLKPGNVMLVQRAGETGLHALVMDFGMALPVSSVGPAAGGPPESPGASSSVGSPSGFPGDDSPPTVTLARPPGWGFRGGTPDYFAPEQSQGAPATTATDVYTLALVLADMLGVPRPVRLKPEAERMPQRWARILQRCLETDPSMRFTRPVDMSAALRSSVDGSRRRIALAAAAVMVVAAVAASLYLMRPEATTGTVNRMLLKEDASISLWCPSPDGRFLAATTYDTGDLVLRDLKSGKLRRLTHKGSTWASQPGGAREARFSPDGFRIAYQWGTSRADSELRIIDADGHGERTLFQEAAAHPEIVDWSPDGSQLLVRVLAGDLSRRLVLISPETGATRTLPQSASEAIRDVVRFGLDATSFVFDVSRGDTSSEIHSLSSSGAESTLVAGPGMNSIIGWSPDRRRLVFTSDRRGHSGIWAVAVSGQGAQGDPQELVTDEGNWDPLGITGNGTLFYRNIADATDVYTAELDLAKGQTTIAPRRLMDHFIGSFAYPGWSEDGHQLVFSSTHDAGSPPQINIYDLRSRDSRVLHPDLSGVYRPQWTAHGNTIAVLGGGMDGTRGLYSVDPKSSRSALIISARDVGTNMEGVWSPDGTIHFNRYPRGKGIFRLNVKTGERRVLYVPVASEDLGLENLTLSPDGQMLAFHSRRDAEGTAALMLMPAEGGPARALLRIRRPECFLYGAFTWAPDSRKILVARTQSSAPSPTEKQISEIWVVPVDGGAPFKVDFPEMRIASLRLNPDGKTIAFASSVGRSEIWTLQNFL